MSLESFTTPMPMTGAADDQDWSRFERQLLRQAVNGHADSGGARRGHHYGLVIISSENVPAWSENSASGIAHTCVAELFYAPMVARRVMSICCKVPVYQLRTRRTFLADPFRAVIALKSRCWDGLPPRRGHRAHFSTRCLVFAPPPNNERLGGTRRRGDDEALQTADRARQRQALAVLHGRHVSQVHPGIVVAGWLGRCGDRWDCAPRRS